MAVDYASSSSVAEASAANATYTAPTGITDGDLLLIWHFEFLDPSPAPTPTPPSGFAIWPTGTWPMTNAIGTDQSACWLWYKFASGESGNYTVTHSTCFRRGIIARVSGNDSTLSSALLTQNTAKATTTTWTGFTTAVNSTLVMAFGADMNDTANNLTPPTGTTPTFTERVDIGGEYLATGVLATAGATGNKTMTNNNAASSEPFFAALVGVAPSTGAAAVIPDVVMAPFIPS